MWAATTPGEGAALYDAAIALRDLMVALGIAADGGKDSLSMAARVGDELVKAPGEVVVSAYASMPDVTRVVTPDIKQPGTSKLMLLDLAPGKGRLGGSAIAQAFGQIGDESADVDDPDLLKRAFQPVQKLIGEELIFAGHDRSDGGLLTTLVEMAISGNCGIDLNLAEGEEVIRQLFSEELGMVIEYLPANEDRIGAILREFGVPVAGVGETRVERRLLQGNSTLLEAARPRLLEWWEQTSDQIELLQENPTCAREQAQGHDRRGPGYRLSFEPEPTASELLLRADKPKVAIVREEGSNGDREMTSAFHAAGFESWDVTMSDLLRSEISLDRFRGIVFVGGFSYADVLDSAKGWAGIIRFNPRLKEMFDAFYRRPDTFSLGVCNGCQLTALLGWVPWLGIEARSQPRFIFVLRTFENRASVLEIPDPKDTAFLLFARLWIFPCPPVNAAHGLSLRPRARAIVSALTVGSLDRKLRADSDTAGIVPR